MTRVLVDTGPLVALLNGRDRHHAWARKVFDTIEPPVFTCEAVISEACFLLGQANGGQEALLSLVSKDVIRLDFRMASEIEPIAALVRKYASIPMSLADACLVRMSELESRCVVLTLDNDFRVYRRNRRQVIPCIVPGR